MSSNDVQPIAPENDPAPIPAPVTLGNPPLVSDAKKLIAAKYLKLHGRFNTAFNGLPEDMTLKDAIDTIEGDVAGWLVSMPDNFKTSNHALSRPKFGISFLLQNEEVRAILGSEYCDLKNTHIERAFEALKKDIVIPSEKKDKEGSTSSKRERERENEQNIIPADDVMEDNDTVGGDGDIHETLAKVLTRNAELEQSNKFYSDALIKIFHDQYGKVPAELLQNLIERV